MNSAKFRLLITQTIPNIEADILSKVVLFRELVIKENEKQNLTRLLSAEDFFEGHLLDVLELNKVPELRFPALDLGSGAGVPGLLSGILNNQCWILAESEKRKAEFLRSAVKELGLEGNIDVFNGRAEEYLKKAPARSIVVRAVGSLQKIYSWLRKCSTWNNLILLKGPNWGEEWRDFIGSPIKSELKLMRAYEYRIGAQEKMRVIAVIERGRVPHQ